MAQQRPKSKAFVPIGTVLEKVLAQYRHGNDPALLQVWPIWERVVGPAIAANARPVAFKGDLLLVHVSSSTWLHHLHFLEKDILAQINAALGGGRISQLKMKVGTF